MNKERQALYDLGTRRSKSLILEVQEGNNLIDLSLSILRKGGLEISYNLIL